MNCETVQENLSLYLYGELNFHDEEQFDSHISSCSFCAEALDHEREWHAAALAKGTEPSLELLSGCRRELSRNLDMLQPPKPSRWEQFLETLDIRPSRWSTQLATASLLVFIGFSGARFLEQQSNSPTGEMTLLSPSTSTPVRFIRQTPGDADQIEIGVDEIKQHRLLFRRDDPALRSWAMAATTQAEDPSLRLDSIDLLSAQPCTEAKPALLTALRDADPAVRQRALGALQPCAHDQAVQSTLLQLIVTDQNPLFRMQAMEFFQPPIVSVTDRRQFAGALQGVAERERDGRVRLQCERILKEIKASPVTY